MAAAKYFFLGAVVLFGGIGAMGWMKKTNLNQAKETPAAIVQEIPLSVKPEIAKTAPLPEKSQAKPANPTAPPQQIAQATNTPSSEGLPEADRIHQLFATDSSKLPIVETLSYTSRVPWLKGRPAWIADYATQYETSRHFIARSLNKKPDYFSQKVGPGDRFNVFAKDKNIQFHLLIDLSRNKMWLYYLDVGAGERVLLKTYRVGVGRLDQGRKSGYLTPTGKYSLGEKVAIYKPGTMGIFQDQKTEMIRVFGTRWIPFEQELEGCTESAKGYGLHGAPWTQDPVTGQLVEDKTKIGKYDSDGCIRLCAEDMEEIFAIVITKPTTVELVRDFHEAKLPGIARTTP